MILPCSPGYCNQTGGVLSDTRENVRGGVAPRGVSLSVRDRRSPVSMCTLVEIYGLFLLTTRFYLLESTHHSNGLIRFSFLRMI